MNEKENCNRVCPQCKMPAYFHNGDKAYYGPWATNDLDLDELTCLSCGWVGNWEEVEYELV